MGREIEESIQETVRFTARATATSFRPLPDEDACYRLVGLITAELARIEMLLDQSIYNLAGVDPRVGACLTGQMTGPLPRFNSLRQLAKHRSLSEVFVDEGERLKGVVMAAYGERNKAVHDPWLEDTGTGEAHQFRGKSKRDTEYGPTPTSKDELEATLAKFRAIRDEVSKLVSALWTETRPAS